MPIFLFPYWLSALIPIAGLGLIALWRGRHNLQRISSTRLWRGLESQSSGTRARSLDPLWALLVLAALLAASALAGPEWIAHSAPAPRLPFLGIAIRAIAGQPDAQLFVRSIAGTPPPVGLSMDVLAAGTAHTYPLPPDSLQQGTIFSDIPAAASIDLHVHDDRAAADYHFRRDDVTPFAILRAGRPMPALERIMRLQPGFQSSDTALRPAVWLIDDPAFSESDFSPGPGAIVIVSTRTPLAGISPLASPATAAAPSGPAAAGITPAIAARSPLLAAVSFQDVHVYHWSSVSVSTDWSVLATVDGHPWLASRTDPASHALWIWLGSALNPADTDWPLDPSFVIFFTNVAAHLHGGAAAPGHVLQWTLQSGHVPAAAVPHPISLSPYVLACALAMVLLVMIILARRA